MKMNKLVLLLSALVLGAFVLTACSSDAQEAVNEAVQEVAEDVAEVAEDVADSGEAEEVVEEEVMEEMTCEDAIGCVEVAAGDPIRIASALVISGPNESLGLDSQYGVEIAISDRGEVAGHAVELQAEDDGCSAEGGQTAGQKVASDPTIAGVIGTSCSGAGVPMSQIVCAEGIAMISPSNTAPVLTGADSRQACYFRTAHNDKIQGAAMADFVFNTLGLTKAAAIHDGDPYTEGLASVFRDSFTALGGEIVAFEAEASDATNVEPLLTSVAAAGPELIYAPVFIPLGSLIVKTAQEIDGLEGVVLAAADGVQSPDFIEASGDAAEGMYLSGPNLAFGNDIYDSFLATYQENYGTEPTAPFHAHAYDATNMLLNAIEAVAMTDADGNTMIGRQALIDALSATSGMDGITGTITCDEFGDCADADIAISQVVDGAFAPAGGMMEEAMDSDGVELRFAYYGDGGEPDAMQALIDGFEAANEGITVELDVVPYETIDTQLPVQVDTGEGPDMARITNFGFYNGRLLDMTDYMADAAYLRDNFPGPVMDAMGEAGGVYGFPDGFTVTGPYVNKTLFDQAEVEMPGADAGWAEWADAAQAVAEATGVQYAISVDRTGHRFAGPAMSSGATLIDADGNFTVDTEGFRAFAEELNSWHVDGITPSEVWLVGDSVNSCMDAFKSGELVMCMSGSWQINGLAADVGDAFDWVVVPNPGGDSGTGVAGGSAVVAIGDTEHPAEVSMFMEYLAQAENYGAFSASTLLLPAQTEVASNGVEFATEDAQVLAALAAFTSEIPRLQDQAVQLNVHPFAFAYYRNSANRIGQYIAGELSLDDALAGLQEDIDDAIAEATAGAEEEAAAAPAAALEPAELRFTYYGDGGEPDAMQALIDKFEAANPGVTVVLDVVPYDTIDTQLPVQVDTGEGPDMARITNFGFYNGRLLDMTDYMADAGYLRDNFPGPVMDAMGEAGGVYGFPDGFTVTGPYVNKTLFDQAEVEMPGADAGWAEWADAAQAVAEATGVQYAISVDRTGHRFAGPAMSSGATLIDGDGNFTVDTEGFRAFAEELNSWHVDGITPSEVWLVGDSVNSCMDAFKSGELVMCMSGSWQINGLAADVGDAFDWVVAPNPGGDSGTGVAGGSAVVALADTEYPAQVSAFMEFIAQAENYGEFSASTLLLPAQTEVANNGVDFATEDAQVLAALGAFTSEIPRLQDQAVQLNVHPFAFAYYRNSANRIGQYIAGELSLDDALAGLQEDIDDAIAEASTIAVGPDDVGGENNPIEVLFVPSAEADVIVTGGEVMAEALNAATGLNFTVSVPTSYAATVEAICASPENTMAFIPALGYVLANNRCDVEVGAAAVRFGLSWYASQIVVPADSDIESIDDLAGKTWAVPDLGSTSGFLYPSVMFDEAGVTVGEIVEAGGHSQAMLAVYNGEVDFATAFFSPPLTDPSWAYGDAPEPYDKTTCARNDEGRTFCGDVRALDARASVTDTAADIFEATRIVMLSPQIPNDTMSFGPDFPEELKGALVDAMVEFAASDACQDSICSDDFYNWSGLDPVADAFYDPVRGLIDALGYTDEDIFGG